MNASVWKPEGFSVAKDGMTIVRTVSRRDGTQVSSTVISPERIPSTTSLAQEEVAALYDSAYLRSSKWPQIKDRPRRVRCVDLFSGTGLMSLGVWEACRALGLSFESVFAVDSSTAAAEVFNSNFGDVCVSEDIRDSLNGTLGKKPSSREKKLKKRLGRIDLVVGGPPCQGHSSLNNHTRGTDPRNGLYDRMARFAEVVRPVHVIIENVSEVVCDSSAIVDRTANSLRHLDYVVHHGTIDLSRFGVPQRRRRHFLLASRVRDIDFDGLIRSYAQPARTVSWAIGDLLKGVRESSLDETSRIARQNEKRMKYLFDHDTHDLPNRLRPDCHRFKKHSYNSVYGRMYWDKPAQTITTGFTSMGQGRYVHPRRRRVITPREAARLQFIPDFFSFNGDLGRTALAEAIGNAVPPKITYVMALELLR
jgi:DNA (cytosine-5)-methyltransferase 1